MFSGYVEDVRYALRLLVRQPVFTSVAIILLALGIGANTAIFSIIDSVLLQPLPYRDPDRLFFIRVRDTTTDRPAELPNAVEFKALESGIQSAESVGALLYQPFNIKMNGRSYLVTAAFASARYYDALGLRLNMGRRFHPDEFQSGKNQVVIISEQFWRDKMGRDPSVIGKTVQMENETHVIAGIFAAAMVEFRGPEAVVPLPLTPELLEMRERRSMMVAVRLKPGASRRQADEEIKAVYQRLAESLPQSSRNKVGFLVPARQFFTSAAYRPLGIFAVAVGLVLILACTNLASLLLARTSARLREVAIRAALGASQGRIFRQMLTESIMLACLGGAAGFAVAGHLIEFIKQWAGLRFPRMEQASLNLHAVLFACLASVLAGVLFGTAPAWSVLRRNLVPALSEESRGSSGGASRSLLRNLLVVMEVAICAVLLVTAGLLYRTYANISGLNMGFHAENVLLLRTMLPTAAFPEETMRASFQRNALERLRAVPGVLNAGITAYPPLAGVEWPCRFRLISGGDASIAPREALYNTVSPGYFDTIGAPILAGRDFADSDTPTAHRVVIISDAFRRKYFGGSDPIGHSLSLVLFGKEYESTVAGVVGDIAHRRPEDLNEPAIYESFTQRPWPFPVFAVKCGGPVEGFTPTITRIFSEISSDVAADQVSPLTRRIDLAIGQQSLALVIFAAFAVLAIILSAVGIYGVLAVSVTQRRREIGIRMALGASPDRIRKLILWNGLALAGTGLTAGLAIAPLAGKALRSLLYGVQPLDWITFASVAALLLSISVLAALLPALRAGRIHPAVALRE